jgi:hypothetical protein
MVEENLVLHHEASPIQLGRVLSQLGERRTEFTSNLKVAGSILADPI